MAGGVPTSTPPISGGFLKGKALIFPLSLVISLFFLCYGLLDVLNKHFQDVLGVTRLESTGLQVMYFLGGYLLFSPVAAEILKRKGYKFTIITGLSLYSLGAVMFWPTAHFSSPGNEKASFGGFLACTFVIACGLATLEVSANSYAVVIGDPASASPRLQFCQSWNGVASFVGPLIASKAFFSGENANNLVNVQYVYLAVACAGLAVGVMFFFAKLPEVEEQVKQRRGSIANDATIELAVGNDGKIIGEGPIWKQYNMIFAFWAQFFYVGAQVACASLFINYATESGGFAKDTASQMLSYALITFTVGRFIAFALAVVFESDFLIVIYACFAIALTSYVATASGSAGVGVLIVVFFFMAPMYPSLFSMGTANLGRHTRRGAGILVCGVAGGGILPPIQAAVADGHGTKVSYAVPACAFVVVLAYAGVHWFKAGFPIFRGKGGVSIATSIEGGAVGGVMSTVHYDERKLSTVAIENIRRSSVGDVTVKGVTGGLNLRRTSVVA